MRKTESEFKRSVVDRLHHLHPTTSPCIADVIDATYDMLHGEVYGDGFPDADGSERATERVMAILDAASELTFAQASKVADAASAKVR